SSCTVLARARLYAISLHDALPISASVEVRAAGVIILDCACAASLAIAARRGEPAAARASAAMAARRGDSSAASSLRGEDFGTVLRIVEKCDEARFWLRRSRRRTCGASAVESSLDIVLHTVGCSCAAGPGCGRPKWLMSQHYNDIVTECHFSVMHRVCPGRSSFSEGQKTLQMAYSGRRETTFRYPPLQMLSDVVVGPPRSSDTGVPDRGPPVPDGDVNQRRKSKRPRCMASWTSPTSSSSTSSRNSRPSTCACASMTLATWIPTFCICASASSTSSSAVTVNRGRKRLLCTGASKASSVSA